MSTTIGLANTSRIRELMADHGFKLVALLGFGAKNPAGKLEAAAEALLSGGDEGPAAKKMKLDMQLPLAPLPSLSGAELSFPEQEIAQQNADFEEGSEEDY